MRTARYFAVPEDALGQWEEFTTQGKAFVAVAEKSSNDEPYVVIKVIKEPKVKEVV